MNYAIILAGGIGSRFWPLSRHYLPKQFLRIVGSDTFFEATLKRLRVIFPEKNIFIVTNRKYAKEIKSQSAKFGIPKENIILEPRPLNTLPAIGACAQLIRLKDPEANLLVFPSDHYIKDKIKFKQAISRALQMAHRDLLCLIGVKPDKPSTGYGYINAGKKISQDVFYVKSFQEKPNQLKAEKLFSKKNIFWNAGIFCFKSEIILRETKRYLPGLYRQISQIKQKSDIGKIWHKIKPISIDYGLLEKTKNLAMVAAKFYWRDLGSWDAVCDVLSKDKKNNIILADNIDLGSNNIFICSNNPKRIIATVGIQDLIIVDTKDALLVCKKQKAQEVKRIVEILKGKRKRYA